MKIQYLAVIFILIIMPIIIVFNEYMNTQMTLISTEAIYDERLLDSTYDAIKAFQLNTINTTYYMPETRVANIEAAVKSFYNSITTSFNYSGNTADSMKAYIPAIVFTMYDGYYVYSAFENELTGKTEEVDSKYEDGKILSGLKPYVSYTCKYHYNGKDYIITYSLENYVTVDIFRNGEHTRKEGYLLNVEKVSDTEYKYDGISIKASNTEVLVDVIPKMTQDGTGTYQVETNSDGTTALEKCRYTIRDGTKYYYEGENESINQTPNPYDRIFYIDNDGNRVSQVSNYQFNQAKFMDYYNEIFANNTGFQYYKEAYEFTTWLLGSGTTVDIDGDGTLDEGEGLSGLTINHIYPNSPNYAGYEFADVGNIFEYSTENHLEYSNSNFNRHRMDVIRAVITTNLSTAISGFKAYTTSDEDFLMPKISESDWDLLENNICIATFFQGLRVGGKLYNNYAVVPNNFNKEFVRENDIFILRKLSSTDITYTFANDTSLKGETIWDVGDFELTYYPAVLKIDFERRKTFPESSEYFNPISYTDYDVENAPHGFSPILMSYTCMAGSGDIESLKNYGDMYRYLRSLGTGNNNIIKLRRAFYIGLGRQRKGSFKYTITD